MVRSAGRSAPQDSSRNAAALFAVPIARVIGGHKGSATGPGVEWVRNGNARVKLGLYRGNGK